MSGIRVSPKHGVNPSIGVCFWCGEDDGTIVLRGRLMDDREAPRRAVYTMEPCDKCKANMATGITIMEAKMECGEPKATGAWVVIKEEAACRLFQPQSLADQVVKMRKAWMEPDAFQQLFGGAK